MDHLKLEGRIYLYTKSQLKNKEWRRELVAMLGLPAWCLMIGVWLFLAETRVCLQFVIAVFPDHTQFFLNHKIVLKH